MSDTNDSIYTTFRANAALGIGTRVTATLSGGNLVLSAAGATDRSIGVLERDSAVGKDVAVKLWAPTKKAIANGVIAAGAHVAKAAAGKVAPGVAADPFMARTASTADGDEIELIVKEPE